jgi:hypothetical protein
MKVAKNMILIKGNHSMAFSVRRRKELVEIDFYKDTYKYLTQKLSLDEGSVVYYNAIELGYKEAF